MPKFVGTERQRRHSKMADFTRFVKTQLTINDMTQAELGQLLGGISQPAVSAKMRDESFTLEDIMIIVTYFNVPDDKLKKLLTYEGGKTCALSTDWL